MLLYTRIVLIILGLALSNSLLLAADEQYLPREQGEGEREETGGKRKADNGQELSAKQNLWISEIQVILDFLNDHSKSYSQQIELAKKYITDKLQDLPGDGITKENQFWQRIVFEDFNLKKTDSGQAIKSVKTKLENLIQIIKTNPDRAPATRKKSRTDKSPIKSQTSKEKKAEESSPLPSLRHESKYPPQPFNSSSHSSSSSSALRSGSLSQSAEITPLKAYEELQSMISKAPINTAAIRQKLIDFNAENKLDGAVAVELVEWLRNQQIDQLKSFIKEKIRSLQEPKVTVTPYSSEAGGTVKNKIFTFLNKAQQRVILVSDQFTDNDMTKELIRIVNEHSIDLQILVGDNNKSRVASHQEKSINTLAGLPCKAILSGRGSSQSKRTCMGNTYYAPHIGNQHRSYKMHNKFIVVDDKVLLGSPNATQTAYELNVESFVVIEDPALANLYKHYYDYMLSQASPAGQDVQEPHQPTISPEELKAEMDQYNANPKIQVCLAPVCPIKDFIISKLHGATDIKINMFLISKYAPGDMVEILRGIRHGVPILLNIDHEMYEKSFELVQGNKRSFYVQKAIQALIPNNNMTIRKIALQQGGGSFHDKLILIKHGNKKSVIIGSAGFTKDVQENQNYENMVWIEDEQVYDGLEGHIKKFMPGSGENISGKVSRIDQAYSSEAEAKRQGINNGQEMGGVYWGIWYLPQY